MQLPPKTGRRRPTLYNLAQTWGTHKEKPRERQGLLRYRLPHGAPRGVRLLVSILLDRPEEIRETLDPSGAHGMIYLDGKSRALVWIYRRAIVQQGRSRSEQ